ncbi:MAG TPA: ankyrin repeat domain-containing protein [Burkholderiaceae bacterium]|nr:ankyrin repeat domain-containing protein [Burkholderiaceae bacterium]
MDNTIWPLTGSSLFVDALNAVSTPHAASLARQLIDVGIPVSHSHRLHEITNDADSATNVNALIELCHKQGAIGPFQLDRVLDTLLVHGTDKPACLGVIALMRADALDKTVPAQSKPNPSHAADTWIHHLARYGGNAQPGGIDIDGDSHALIGLQKRFEGLRDIGLSLDGSPQEIHAPLRLAIEHGNHDAVRALLAAGARVDVASDARHPPLLHLSISKPHADLRITHMLLDHGTDIDVLWTTSVGGYGALHLAILEENDDAVRVLIDRSANVNLHATAAASGLITIGITPMHLAANTGQSNVIRMLQAANAQLDSTTNFDDTPLTRAVSQRQLDAVETLLALGANPLHERNDGLTCVHFAARTGVTEIMAALVQHGASVHARSHDGLTPLHVAAHHRRLDTVRALLHQGADLTVTDHFENTALHFAIEKDNTAVVDLLLRSGASPNVTNAEGLTPLYLASSKGYAPLIDVLIRHGASLEDSLDDDTSLMAASREGHVQAVHALLQHGAALGVGSDAAVVETFIGGHAHRHEIVKALLEAGASANTVHYGATALMREVSHGRAADLSLVELLLRHDANPALQPNDYGDIDFVSYMNQPLEAEVPSFTHAAGGALHHAISCDGAVMDMLVKHGANPNAAGEFNLAPLHWAARFRAYEGIAHLLRLGANPNKAAWHGVMPLHLACAHFSERDSDESNIVKLLIQHGADVNARVDSVFTFMGPGERLDVHDRVAPLHLAAYKGDVATARTLIDNGANMFALTVPARSPLELALFRQHWDVVALLTRRMSTANIGRSNLHEGEHSR